VIDMDREATIVNLDTIIGQLTTAALKRELQAVAHKLRYPMADILAKVPGESVADRARQIGVSRQTLYCKKGCTGGCKS
jgi:hypothetical protein